MSLKSSNWILYDGDCPFCRSYVSLLRLRKAIGPVTILSARDRGAEFDQVCAAELNLDEGMVLHYEGQLYHGSDCIHVIAMLSESSGVLRQIVAWVFCSPRRARLLYPWLRMGRNMTLRLLGKKKIRNLS